MPDFSPVIPIDLSGGSNPTPDIHVPSVADPRQYNPNYVNTQLPSVAQADQTRYDGNIMDVIEAQNKPTQVQKDVAFNPSVRDRFKDTTYNPTVNNEDIYGKNQAFYSQLFNGVVKGVADAGISFGQALTLQPNSEWAEEAKTKLENILPSYYTDKQHASYANWLPFSGGSANFWADKIFKGTADMLGMIGATAVQDMAIGATTEGLGEIPLIGNQIAKISMRASKYLTGVDKGAEFLRDISLEGSELKAFTAEMAAQNLKNVKANQLMTARGFGTNFLFSHYMASQGSVQFGNELKNDLMEQYRTTHNGNDATGEDLVAIDKDIDSARNARYNADLGLFMAQSLALPGLLRAFRPANSLTKGIEAEGGKVQLPKATTIEGLDNLSIKATKGGPMINSIVKPFVHGAAVMGGINVATESSTEAIKEHFKNKAKGAGQAGDVINDLYHGFGKTLGNVEGIGNILTSAIIGGLVGNIEHGISGIKAKRAGLATPEETTRIAVDNMNKWNVSGLFRNNYDATADVMVAQNDMQDAINSGDPFKYKKAQEDAFRGFILSGLKNNMHDIRLEQLKMFRDLPDSELNGVFGDSKTSPEQQRQYIDSLISRADRLKRKYNAVGDVVAQPYIWRQNAKNDEQRAQNEEYLNIEGYKDMLTTYSWNKEVWRDNLNEIERKNKEVHPALNNDLLETLTTRSGRTDLINEYKERVREIEKDMEDPEYYRKKWSMDDLRPEKKTLNDLIDRLENVQNMSNFDPIVFSKVFTDALNFELGGGAVKSQASIPMEEAMPLIERGIEVQYSKGEQRASEHVYNELFTQDGFENYKAEASSYKKGQGIADSQEELNVINEEHSKFLADHPTNTDGVSRLYTLDDNAEIKPYTVSRATDKNGDLVYQVKGWDGDVISSHEKREFAENERNELNENTTYPKVIESTGERNDDGSIVAKDEKGKLVNIHPNVAAKYVAQDTPQEVVDKRGAKNDEVIEAINDKAGTLPELATQSSDIEDPTANMTAEEQFNYLRKMKQFVFRSTISSPFERSKDYNKRAQHFFSNIAEVKSKIRKGNQLRMRMVTSANEKALGLEGLTAHMLKGVESEYPENNIGKRLVVAVFQEFDPLNNTHHFVDVKGNRLVDEKDFDKYILAPMPTTDITYKSEGLEGVSRFQEGVGKTEQIEEQQNWERLRKEIFKVTRAEDTPSYDFAISRGLPRRTELTRKDGKPVYEQHAVTKAFDVRQKLDAFDQLIQVNTGSYVPDFIGDNIKMPKGAILFRDADSFSFQILNNRKLNESEVDNVFNVLAHYADILDNGIKQTKDVSGYISFLEKKIDSLKANTNRSIEENKELARLEKELPRARFDHETRGTSKATIEDIIDYLGGLTFFNRGRLDVGAAKSEIYFSNDRKGVIVIAGKEFLFTSEIFHESSRYSMMNEIKAALSNAWTNVNNKKLNERKPFRELSVVDSRLVAREWKSYQHYLLSDKLDLNNHPDDGKDRDFDDIPVTTTVAPLDKNNTLESNFEAKYAIVRDNQEIRNPDLRFEATVKKQAPKPEKTATPAAKPVEETAKEDNFIKFANPDYSKALGNFEYSVDEDGNVSVDESEVDLVLEKFKDNQKKLEGLLLATGAIDPKDLAGKKRDYNVKSALGGLLEGLAAEEYLENKGKEPVPVEDAVVEAKVEAAKVELTPTPKVETPAKTEEVKPATPTPDAQKAAEDYNNKPAADDFDFRFVNAKELEYPIHDLERSEQWFSKNLPFTFERLDTLINNGGLYAFGRYADMHAEWYKLAKKGTIEHEAFEGIWKSFTTAPERTKLINEFNSRAGEFTHHEDGRTIKYSEANAYEVKEQLAEELGQYILDGKLYKAPKSVKTNLIARMFEDFVNWVKSILNGGIKKMFNKINAGYYKDIAPVNDFRGLEKFDTNKALPELSTSETYNIVRGVTNRVMQILLSNNRSLVDFDVRGNKGLKSLLEKVYGKINEGFNDNTKRGTAISRYELGQADPTHPEAINEAQYRNFQKIWKAMDENWSIKEGMSAKQRELTVEGMVREYLGTYGVKVTEIAEEGGSVSESESESASKRILEDAFTIDVKKNALASVKLLIGTVVDGTIENGVKVEKRDKATNMPVPVKFGKVFSFLSDTLKDYNTFPEKMDKLRELSLTDSNIRDILKRMKIGLEPSKVTLDDIKLRSAFNNTFGKQRPEAWTYYINKDGSTVFSAQNLNVSIRSQREAWADAIKVDAVNHGLVKIKADGAYVFNPEGVKREGGIGTEAGMLKFLNDLGIDFTRDMRNKLSREKAPNQTKSDYDRFNEAVVGIYEQFHKGGLKDKEFSFGSTGQAGRFNDLAELYLKSLGISDSTYYNIEGKQQSQDVGTNFISKVSNDINNSATKDELFQRAPHMNAPFRLDSVYLNSKLFNGNTRVKGFQLSADILQGKLERGEMASNAKPLASMTHPERVMSELNANLNKFYYVLVPADSKQEWVQKLEHIVTLADFERGEAWDKLYNIFNGYYQTERTIALDKGKGSIDSKYKSLMHEFMGGYENEVLSREALNDIITDRAKSLFNYLKQEGFIIERTKETVTDKDGNKITTANYSIPDIDLKFMVDNKLAGEKKRANQITMSESSLMKLFQFTEANYMINNVEFHKLYFGDPADIKDPLKRYKSFISPRQESLYGDQEFNDIMNRELNELRYKDAAGEKASLKLLPGEYGHFIHTDNINTFTAADQTVYLRTLAHDAGIYPDDKKLGDLIRKSYTKIDPTDGGGFTTIMGHREMTYRKGQVTKDHDKMYNYIMAEDRQLMYEDGKLHDREGEKGYYRPELKAYDEKIMAEGYYGDAYLNVYKPIYSGVDINGKTVLDKYSLAPLTYRMVRGTPLEKIYMNMVESGTHYFVMKSGRKIGAAKAYDLYKENGRTNDAMPTSDQMTTLSWKYFGIQVETEGRHHHNALGTQSSTMVAMNLQRFGTPIDFRANRDWHSLTEAEKLGVDANGKPISEIYRLVRHNQKMMTAMQRHGYNSLLRKLGIDEETDGSNTFYSMKDKTKLEQLLKAELLQRDATQNQKDALTLNEEGEFTIPLDAAANFKQIKQILYSKVEKDIAKIKQNGGPKVMVPGIMDGNVDGKEIHTVEKDGKTYLVSSGLKFYEAEYKNGKRTGVSRMEVMITSDIPKEMRKHPRWKDATDAQLMEHLNTEEGRKVLEGIGFRIPTQELNSIDSFIIKAFLPDYMGDTIVVPEAITTKAGSDFDIDKLNTYLKNIYIDKEGNVKQVPFLGIGEEARAKFASLDIYKAPKEVSEDDVEAVPDEEELDEMGEDELDKLYKRSLQNEYYDSMSKLVLHPDNFERLIKPNSADKFKSISDTLEGLAPGEFTANRTGSLLDRMFMSQMRQAFVGGKNDVGIAASNQKNHSLNQLVNLFIDPDRVEFLSSSDRKFIDNARIMLPHNTEMGFSTASGITDAKGNYISDNLSQCIDGYVDIAKGAWIMNIVQDTTQAGTFMFLLKMGVDPDTAALFMNQPIIREYVKVLKKSGSMFMLRSPKSAQRMRLLDLFPVGVDTSKKNPKWAQQYSKLINKTYKAGFNIEKLGSNIEDYYRDGKLDERARNIEQHAILKEFMKYTVMADHNFKIQQSLTYDTNPDPDPAMQRFKARQVQEALTTTIFANVDKLYEQSHLGPLKDLIVSTSEAMSEGVFRTGSKSEGGAREVINSVIDQYPTRMGKDNKMRAANAAEEGLISYLVQTSIGINSRIHELLVDKDTNMAKRLVDMRKAMKEYPDSDLANNEFFKELMVSAKKRRTDVKNVFMARKDSSSYTMDMYTDAMREFRDNPLVKEKFGDFYNDLVTTGFLQSGLSNSKQAFAKFVPSEDWAKLVAPVVMDDNNWSIDRLQGFLKSDVFFRNQWRNKYLTPLVAETWKTESSTNKYTSSDSRFERDTLNAWAKFRDENNVAYAAQEIVNGGRTFKTFPGFNYVPFRIKPNSKEGSYRFITFSAVDADFHNRQEDLWSVEDKKQLYLLKRVHDENDNPVRYMGDYIYIPIAPRGDSVNAQEWTEDSGPSVLKTDCYNVLHEYPETKIAEFFENLKQEFGVASDAPEKDKGTMDDPYEFRMPKDTPHIGKIESGDMTGVSFSEKDAKANPIVPGSIVKFTDGDKEVYARALTGWYPLHAIKPETWARVEGRSVDEYSKANGEGQMQFLFRAMDATSGELVTDKSPGSFKPLLGWKRIEKKEKFTIMDPQTRERDKEVQGYRVSFTDHPDLKLIAYEDTFETKTGNTRTGWMIADEATGITQKKYYQNSLKDAVDSFIRTTNRDIEDQKNTDQLSQLNLTKKLEKSEKSVTFTGFNEKELSDIVEKSKHPYESKDVALTETKNFHDRLLKETPDITKEDMQRQIECYLSAPF